MTASRKPTGTRDRSLCCSAMTVFQISYTLVVVKDAWFMDVASVGGDGEAQDPDKPRSDVLVCAFSSPFDLRLCL